MKGGKGFGFGWGNIVRPRKRSKGSKGSKSESIFEDSDIRSAKRRQEETNKLAEYIFARDIGHSKCIGMSKDEFKKNFRPMGGMGAKADEIINMLWDSPIGALQRKKKKRTKNKKHKMSISSKSAPKSMSKMERRAGKVKRKKTRMRTKRKSKSKRRSKSR